MFEYFKKVELLEIKVESLEGKLEDAKKQIEYLELEKERILSEKRYLVEECGFEVDFNKMNAFSIERLLKNSRETTCIGYFKQEQVQVPGEWQFECSKITHERLVKEFLDYKSSQQK